MKSMFFFGFLINIGAWRSLVAHPALSGGKEGGNDRQQKLFLLLFSHQGTKRKQI